MRLTLSTPWTLIFLLIIPYLWWIARQSESSLGRKHLRVLGTVQSAAIVLLVLALAEPTLYIPVVKFSVVYLLDVSQSVSPSAIDSAIQWIQKTNDWGRPAHARFVPFAANSTVLENLDQLQHFTATGTFAGDAIDFNATDIEQAVGGALRNFSPHHLKRLVLLTDGNETSGHMMNTLAALKQQGIHVYTIPLQARTNEDVWVEAVVTAGEIQADELFRLEAYIYSQFETSAQVDIRYANETLGTRQVHLAAGLNRVPFQASIKDHAGPVTIETEVKAARDEFPENNKFQTALVVNGRPKILYIEGRIQSAHYLEAALGKEGFALSVITPNNIPSSVETLDAYDAIILSDVAATSLTNQQMRTVATYVRELGGGLILAGGENNYGEGGYSGTPVEEILPVKFEVEKEKPIALIVVLDKSESMTGLKMDLAKEATKAPVELMKDTDSFGVVAFDSRFFWAVPFQRVTDRTRILDSVSMINASGETDIFPALEEAYKQLAQDSAMVKHVILLSDGKTFPDDFKSLVAKMTDAKITLSTVAVGTSADRELLSNIASWGKGRTYYLTDPSRVPQIFVDETELAKGKALREDRFRPLVRKNVQVFKGINFDDAPALLGYVATRSKDTAEVLLESARRDPILARWQYGLGKTAAFTSDLKNRWAQEWLQWKGYPKFWSQLVREIMRPHENNDFNFHVTRNRNDANITIDAIRNDGQFRNKLEPKIKVVGPDESVSDVRVLQAGPGSYEARFPLSKNGPYLFRSIDPGGRGGSVRRILAYSYPDEYHFYPATTDVLQSISEQTNGKFQPKAEDIFDPKGEVTMLPMLLWPYAAGLALLLYFGGVLLRRLRLED